MLLLLLHINVEIKTNTTFIILEETTLYILVLIIPILDETKAFKSSGVDVA